MTSIERLLEYMGDDDPLVRADGARQLGGIEGAEAAEALRRALHDPDGGVRYWAVRGLEDRHNPEDIPLIGELIQDPEGAVRQGAVMALGFLGHPDALPYLMDALCHPEGDLRFQAVVAVHQLADRLSAEQQQAVVERLLVLMGDSADPELQSAVVAALTDLDPDRARKHLPSLLREKDPDVRFHAALGLLPEEQALAEVIAALSRRDHGMVAARALGETGCQAAREPLAALARRWSAPWSARIEAAGSLVLLGEREWVGWLLDVVKRRWRFHRGHAIEVLGRVGAQEAVDSLAPIALSARDRHADVAVLALAAIDSPSSRQVLHRVAREHPDPDVRTLARQATDTGL